MKLSKREIGMALNLSAEEDAPSVQHVISCQVDGLRVTLDLHLAVKAVEVAVRLLELQDPHNFLRYSFNSELLQNI